MASKKTFCLYVKILQKGHELCNEVFPLVGKKNLKLTSRIGAPLSIPFYPFAQDLELLEIRKNQVTVNVNGLFEGFLLSSGNFVDLLRHEVKDRSFLLTANDYASLVFGDLRIMLKVAPFVPEKTVAITSKYRASIIQLFWKEKSEAIAFGLSLFISCFLFLCFVGGMLIRPDDRPKNFESLEKDYTLPFIASQSLSTSPEALKQNLNRQNYIVSVVTFYRNLTHLLLGTNTPNAQFLYATSVAMYKERFNALHAMIAQRVEEKTTEDTLIDQTFAKLLLPSVYGESFQQKILRIISKIESIQESYEVVLESRRKTTEEFKNDPDYDWGQYVIKKEHNGKSAISKVKVFDQLTNEQAMYHEAMEFAQKASYLRGVQEKTLKDSTWLTSKNIRIVKIDPKLEFFSFINRPTKISLNESKLERMPASGYGEKIKIAQEPVMGKLEPMRVARAIADHKFHINICYQAALRKNHTLKGAFDMTWLVDTQGKSLDIKTIKDTVSDSRMLECVKSKINSWQFPKPAHGSVRISHTFQFEPKHG